MYLERAGDKKIHTAPNTDANTRHHDFPIIKLLLESLPDLDKSRILNIIKIKRA